MIFNLEAGEVKTLPIVSDKYPESITVKAGENAVFSAVIDKDGVPTEYTYKWYVNNSLVSGATTAVYTRKTTSDKGVYSVYCEITNKAGTVKTRTATLTVNALPKLDSTKPANVTCYVNESNTFSVAISEKGYPESYTYQWYKNGSRISGATGTSYTYKQTSGGTATLHCEVTNAAGTVSSRKATVTVKNVLTVVPGTFFSSLAQSSDLKEVKKNSDDSWTFWAVAGASYKKGLNVSNYKTMTLKGTKAKFKGTIRVGLFDGSSASSSLVTGFKNTTYEKESFSKTYDISKITGTAYLGVYGMYSDTTDTQYMNVKLTSVVFKE